MPDILTVTSEGVWQVVTEVLVIISRRILELLFLVEPFWLRVRRWQFWSCGFKVQFLRCILSSARIFYVAIMKAKVVA